MAKRVGLSIYGLSLYDGEKKINLNNVKDSKSIVQLIKEHIDELRYTHVEVNEDN